MAILRTTSTPFPATPAGGRRDLQGVIDKLDYIKGLGMTAIWITRSRSRWARLPRLLTRDPYKIDPHLGTLAKLQELVRKRTRRTSRVVLDVVINHLSGTATRWLTDDQHARWFHDLCRSTIADQKSVEQCWIAGLPDLNKRTRTSAATSVPGALYLIDRPRRRFRVDAARHLPKTSLPSGRREFKRSTLVSGSGGCTARLPLPVWISRRRARRGHRFQT